MPDVLLEVTIKAAPDQVFEAITEQPGLASWWTPRVVAEPKVGSTLQVDFGSGQAVVTMEVLTLEPGRKVEWGIRHGLPAWSGKCMTWDLALVENGTKVLFGYRGLADSAERWLPSLSYNWAVNLTRLKDYLEK